MVAVEEVGEAALLFGGHRAGSLAQTGFTGIRFDIQRYRFGEVKRIMECRETAAVHGSAPLCSAVVDASSIKMAFVRSPAACSKPLRPLAYLYSTCCLGGAGAIVAPSWQVVLHRARLSDGTAVAGP
ncbi:hypothetical protein RW1_006_00710 [Rhodococcus wratislaviensis NBRC 100605]|uniref:Uncharacterized protein n=1 Tax=Rhodococcus wratislaviensis NBRC 100605 TaxID=1219028 RepID=X0PXS8_RHOWR|nr:hypothetical protein RW1_006_00710 [Rhodococcus wratislaviensis NBRC 100605]